MSTSNDTSIFESFEDASTMSRRRLLQGMLAAGGAAAIGLPQFGDVAYAASGPNSPIIVTIMLGGGNDGLNTLAPVDSGIYRDFRGGAAVSRSGAHSVGDGLFLNPNLSRLKRRFDAGDVAIVRGVGDPGLDHSHFSGMAKWMAGKASGVPNSGWLGRYMDGLGLDTFGGVSIGSRGVPLHLQRPNGNTIGLPPFPELFGAHRSDDNGVMYNSLSGLGRASIGKGSWTQAIAESQQIAIGAAQRMTPTYSPELPEPAPEDEIVRDLELAARVINLNVGTRVVATGFGDFDTHDSHSGRHETLLDALDRGIDRFFAALRPEHHHRVVVMTFSEFGRRPEFNGSGGVDHGTSSCLFVCGSGVTGGLYGQQPRLDDLDDRRDLKVHVDYRSVYATVLEGFLGADARQVLGGNYEKLGFFGGTPPTPTPTTAPPTTAPPTTQPPKPDGPTCAGLEATIVGTSKADTIVGTPGDDVIVGRGGNDVILGKGGNDVICGNGGNDVIRGGGGNDRLFGNVGRDRINGDNGRDRVRGGAGRDLLKRAANDFFVKQ